MKNCVREERERERERERGDREMKGKFGKTTRRDGEGQRSTEAGGRSNEIVTHGTRTPTGASCLLDLRERDAITETQSTGSVGVNIAFASCLNVKYKEFPE